MAILSRRTIQHLIDDNAKFLSRKQTKKLVADLNRMHLVLSRSLGPEWELILLNTLSKIGKVSYELSFGGRRTPDIYFQTVNDPKQHFAADVTAISDRGFDAKNPIEALENGVIERAEARGIRLNSFSFSVDGTEGSKYGTYRTFDPEGKLSKPFYRGGKKTELKLPPLSRFEDKIFNTEFERFLTAIQNSPATVHSYVVCNEIENISFSISYNPDEEFSTSTYPSFKQISHISENQVFEALKRKAEQLIESDCKAPLGIILCDGDYSPFHHDNRSVNEVIAHFLDTTSEISFVLTIIVNRGHWSSSQFSLNLYTGKHFDRVSAEIVACLEKIAEFLPQPECDSCNAFNSLKSRYPQEGDRKGVVYSYKPNGLEVRISTRTLVELLSGRLSHDDFSKLQGYVAWDARPKRFENPFRLALQSGFMISEVQFQSHSPEDDDALVITFEGPDAAIHPFVVPNEAGKI